MDADDLFQHARCLIHLLKVENCPCSAAKSTFSYFGLSVLQSTYWPARAQRSSSLDMVIVHSLFTFELPFLLIHFDSESGAWNRAVDVWPRSSHPDLGRSSNQILIMYSYSRGKRALNWKKILSERIYMFIQSLLLFIQLNSYTRLIYLMNWFHLDQGH